MAWTYGGLPKIKSVPKAKRPIKQVRDIAKEMFPSIAVENQTQNKLFKLANAISGIQTDTRGNEKKVRLQDKEKQEELRRRLNNLKQEHFRDLSSENMEGLITTEDEFDDKISFMDFINSKSPNDSPHFVQERDKT